MSCWACPGRGGSRPARCVRSGRLPEGPQWYWTDDAPFWNGPSALTAEYVSRIFEEPLPTLEGYSDAELNIGLNYVISPGLGEHMRCLDDPSVPLAARLRCVQACESLFRKLFLPRCSPICRTVTSPAVRPSTPSATCGGTSCRCTAAPAWKTATPFIAQPWM